MEGNIYGAADLVLKPTSNLNRVFKLTSKRPIAPRSIAPRSFNIQTGSGKRNLNKQIQKRHFFQTTP
jgi:hypothetical protein